MSHSTQSSIDQPRGAAPASSREVRKSPHPAASSRMCVLAINMCLTFAMKRIAMLSLVFVLLAACRIPPKAARSMPSFCREDRIASAISTAFDGFSTQPTLKSLTFWDVDGEFAALVSQRSAHRVYKGPKPIIISMARYGADYAGGTCYVDPVSKNHLTVLWLTSVELDASSAEVCFTLSFIREGVTDYKVSLEWRHGRWVVQSVEVTGMS